VTIEKQWDVIAAGDIFVDIVLSGFTTWPQPGEEVFAEHLHREAGGGAAITGSGLSRLGAKVAVFAAIGNDGEWLVDRLSDCHVDPVLIHQFDAEATGLTVSVSTPEDRAFFTFGGANKRLAKLLDDAQVWKELARARLVHLACPIEPDLLGRLTSYLHATGRLVSIDAGWQTEWLKNPSTLEALREIDIFFPNEREARLMTNAIEPHEIMRAFRRAGLRRVAMKLGSRGSMLLIDDEIILQAPHRPDWLDPIETTGAGDAFNAGFIYGCLQGHTARRCLEIGNLCGALSTRGPGGIGSFPTPNELGELL